MKSFFKITFYFILLFILLIISTFFLFSYTGFSLANSNSNSNLDRLQLPFSVNFSEKQIKYIESLSETDLEKLVRTIRLVIEKNNSKINQFFSNSNPNSTNLNNIASNSSQPTTYSNTPTPQTPYYNQSTGQYQSSPASPASNIFNPPPNAAQPTPLQSLMQGVTQGAQQAAMQVDDEKLKSLFPETARGGACEGFGVTGGENGGGGNNLTPKLKYDLSRLCQLTGKKLVISPNGSKRSGNATGGNCDSTSQHQCGKAIDTSLAPYTQEEQIIVTLYFFAHNYGGIGSYGLCSSCAPPHFDHRTFPMRWGPGPGGFRLQNCRAENYPPSMRKAFQMVGADPCALVPVEAMSAKAKQVLQNIGKEDFAN